MQFTTHQDIDAPADYVFQRVTNFDAYERQALRKGASVDRLDGQGPIGIGATWDIAFTFRGRDRQLRAVITELNAPERMVVDTDAKGLTSVAQVTLVALSPRTTRVSVVIVLRAKSMQAKLLMQSMRLAKPRLNKRFRKRIKDQLKDVATDYRRISKQ